MSGIDLVTFHYSLEPGNTVHPNETRPHNEYLTMIEMMFKSARGFHRGIRPVLLTSDDTNLNGLWSGIKRINNPIEPTTLMLSRTKAQQGYLEKSPLKRPIIFIDSDMLFNGTLDEVLSKDFDIAVTCRTRSSVPINGGLMIVNNRRPDIVRSFFKSFVELYEKEFCDKADWYGDQLALVSLLNLAPFAYEYPEMMMFGDCKVLLLPCDTYNFSPENTLEAIESPLTDKILLHFKGQRKQLMHAYWNNYLADKSAPAIWQALRKLAKLLTGGGSTEKPKAPRGETC